MKGERPGSTRISSEVRPLSPTAELLLQDNFSKGLSLGTDAARWRLRPVPGFPEGDGIATTGPAGLTVVPTATDPATGYPAFADPPQPLGETDHLRWALMANHETATGFPGFEIGAGRISIKSALSVQGYGLDRHTYGEAVPDPYRDLRLGASILICMDRQSGMVFDFIITDRCVFAVYERLAFPPSQYAGFSYAVPVLDRQPTDFHMLTLAYDAEAGAAFWYVEDTEVLTIDRIGYRALAPQYSMRDNGKDEQEAAPRQLTCGLALFADRLWGQGVRLTVRHIEAWRD